MEDPLKHRKLGYLWTKSPLSLSRRATSSDMQAIFMLWARVSILCCFYLGKRYCGFVYDMVYVWVCSGAFVCVFSSLFVCLCVCTCPVRSFVAEAINSPGSSAPVVHSFADILALSLVSGPTLHVRGEILTLSKHCSLFLNTTRAFTYQVSNIKGEFTNIFTPQWCGNRTPLGHRLGE